jgi:hypothetical protein
VSSHFKRHKIFYLLFLGCAVIGIVYGIVYVSKIGRVILISDIKSVTLKAIASGNVTAGGIIADNLLVFLGCTALALIFSVNIYFSVVCYLLIIYRGYLIGFNACIMINLFGMGGVANVLIVFIPQQIFILALLICSYAICSRRCFANYRCGFLAFRGVEYRETLTGLAYVGVLMLILTVIQAIFIPIISKSFLFIM